MKLRSKQPNIKMVAKGSEYDFTGKDFIEVPDDHAKILLKNPTIEKYGGAGKKKRKGDE